MGESNSIFISDGLSSTFCSSSSLGGTQVSTIRSRELSYSSGIIEDSPPSMTELTIFYVKLTLKEPKAHESK